MEVGVPLRYTFSGEVRKRFNQLGIREYREPSSAVVDFDLKRSGRICTRLAWILVSLQIKTAVRETQQYLPSASVYVGVTGAGKPLAANILVVKSPCAIFLLFHPPVKVDQKFHVVSLSYSYNCSSNQEHWLPACAVLLRNSCHG